MKPIKIYVEGGLIQDIEDIPEGTTIEVMDFDIEGTDPENITKLDIEGCSRYGDECIQSIYEGEPIKPEVATLQIASADDTDRYDNKENDNWEDLCTGNYKEVLKGLIELCNDDENITNSWIRIKAGNKILVF